MKTTRAKLIGILVVIALVAVWIGTAVIAQRGPNGPGLQMPMGPPPMMKAGAQGVFVLLGGTLVKYDAALKEQGTLRLIGPPAAPPPDGTEPRPPMPPRNPVLLIAPAADGAAEKVVVLLSNELFLVNAASLKLRAKTTLPELEQPQPNPNEPGGPMPMPPGPGALELHSQTLYILRGPQIVAISLEDGSLIGKNMLPKPPAPPAND